MIRGRQPHVLPLMSDPTVLGARCVLIDAPETPYEGAEVFARYVTDGPVEPPVRREDGSGTLLIDVDAGTVRVEIPPGATWVEMRTDWSIDDEDDLAADIGPADPLGGVLTERMAMGPDLRRATREALNHDIDEWLAAHQVSLHIGPGQVTAAPDADEEREVRRESALRDLASRVLRHIDAPGVASRVAQLRGALEALDGHPLQPTLADICDTIDQLRPTTEADLCPAELQALRQKRKRDRRYQRELARRNLVRFIGEGWDDEDPGRHFEVFETDVPPALHTRVVGELVAHAHRIATRLPPKRRRASSPASG